MFGREARDRERTALDLVGVVGLIAFLLGLTWLQTSERLGFDLAAALSGVLSQLAVTLPAALLILAATGLELAAGLVLARLARRRPFESWAEALLAAMVAAVLKDTLLLGLLAAGGLFQQPVLIAINLGIVAAGIWFSRRGSAQRVLATPGWRESTSGVRSTSLALLVAVVWAGPVVLQLASPVVPFVDVLPNYVGPVEHLRTFGWFSPLSATQSPIIGPSRTVLGYDGLLGALATMTNLPAGLAIAGFILPQTVLVAAGVHRLASALRDGNAHIGTWALLAFALSQPFARLGDARGTVVVVPLVCLGLALAAEHLRRGPTQPPTADGHREPTDPWRIGRGAVIGLALGAATVVHPVIGFFAIATVAIAALVRPVELAPAAFVATLTAGLIALPQAATMAGLSLPTLALGAWVPVAIAAGAATGMAVESRPGFAGRLVQLARAILWPLLIAAMVALAAGLAVNVAQPDRLPRAWAQIWEVILESSGLLLVVLAAGIAFGSRGARSVLLLAGLAVGVAATVLVTLLPGNLGFLADALRFEVPKTVHYWLSMIAAIGAAAALAHLWSGGRRAGGRLTLAARAAALGVFVVIAAVPLRTGPIDAYHLGEHRWSETFAIDLRFAGSGFWVGFPDTRAVVDQPRQELIDVLRAEIDAGRLRHDTEVVHVARTFQQWFSTPLGVFAGVFETSISLDPEVTHQTAGGRLFGSRDAGEMLGILGQHLGREGVAYVVLEPAGVPAEARSAIEGAGFAPIFENGQGVVFRTGG